MIEIIPALHILGGRCVSLKKGEPKNCKTYPLTPLEYAQMYENKGFKRIELIDLQGAKTNSPTIFDTLKEIAEKTSLKVTFGGGIKNREALKAALANGAERVICSSIPILQPNVFTYWLECFGGDALIFEADFAENKNTLAVKGWKMKVERDLDELLRGYLQDGLKNLIVKHIGQEGTLEGCSAEECKQIAERFPRLNVMASGGIGSQEDIAKLEEFGIKEAISCRAMIEEKITVNFKEYEDGEKENEQKEQ